MPPERGHHAAFPWAKVPDFLKALAKYPGNPETRIALHLILLTFVRRGELRGARWSEFEPGFLEATGQRLPLWTIPAERMKSRRDHIVPLAPQVVALFRQLHEFSGNTEFMLPHRTRAKTGMSESTLREGMHRIGFGEYTVHGFRALASTELNGLGFRPDVIERQLAHVEANRVRAAYHRTDYLEDRQCLMIKWADMVTLSESERHDAEVAEGSERLEGALPPLAPESTLIRQRRRMMARGLRKTCATGSSYKSTQPHSEG